MEGPDEVLAGVDVDPGLAADRRVHHPQDRGRDLHDVDTPQPRGRHEAGEVGRRPTAEADHNVVAGEADLAEDIPAETGDAQLLGLLTVGDLDRVGLHLRGVAQVRDHRLRGRPQGAGVDNRGTGATGDQVREFTEQTLTDHDLVGAFTGRGDLDPAYRYRADGRPR